MSTSKVSRVVINHTSHLYDHCTWAEYQSISTWVVSFLRFCGFLPHQNPLSPARVWLTSLDYFELTSESTK